MHAYIISHLKNEMPAVFGKDKKKQDLIKGLADVYKKIQNEHEISPGDFPNISRLKENLQNHDFSKFHTLRPKLIQDIDHMLTHDIARLMEQIPNETETLSDIHRVKGGVFASGEAGTFNPFATGATEGFQLGAGDSGWVVSKDKPRFVVCYHKC